MIDSPQADLPEPDERAVVTECDLPQAPEKVWQALTVPKLLAAWLPEAADSEILAAEPNRLLRYRWPAGEKDRDAAGRPLETVVTFELAGTSEGGTHLRVVHRLMADAVACARTDDGVIKLSGVVALRSHRKDLVTAAETGADTRVSRLRSSVRVVPLTRCSKGPVALGDTRPLLRWAA
jgi:uncharacterized protein YndB with AHSA1/START domain